MKKFTLGFLGRERGAIGIFYWITATREAATVEEAKELLYDQYEHITNVTAIKTEHL